MVIKTKHIKVKKIVYEKWYRMKKSFEGRISVVYLWKSVLEI